MGSFAGRHDPARLLVSSNLGSNQATLVSLVIVTLVDPNYSSLLLLLLVLTALKDYRHRLRRFHFRYHLIAEAKV